MPPKNTQTPIQPASPAANPAPSAAPITAGSPLPPPSPLAIPPRSVKPPPKPKKKKPTSTQNTLEISEIRDGMVIMRDGSLRAVIMCQSINFDLMSPEEREAVELNYQNFLNSLFFPIQIFIRSRRIELNNYIERLQKIQASQDNMLLSLLMEDYLAYIGYLIQNTNIMEKQFYIVVPYTPSLLSKGAPAAGLRKLTALLKPTKQNQIVINETDFNQYKTELTQQVQVVLNGLVQLNVPAVPLNTQELIELYYTVYNPQVAENQKLVDMNQLEAPIISKGPGEATEPGERL